MDDISVYSHYAALLGRDFSSFIAKTFGACDPGAQYLPNWHIDLIAEHLEAARRGELNRLIINLPPRYLKSICVSVAWPAWILGHNPAARIMAASYSASLALKHSLDCRRVMQQEWYRHLFPDLHFADDQNEKQKFMTSARGYRIATSVGGTVTGEGGNFLILDDPLSAQQAHSTVARDEVNRWFEQSFASRLDNKKQGVIVVVMQRLHMDDLSGHLLSRGGWTHLCLPAIAPQQTVHRLGACHKVRLGGALLHPDREGEKELERAKAELGSYAFAAQYQQSPVPVEGAMIRAGWLVRYGTAPAHFPHIVQSWDTAIKAGAGNDASACLTFGECEGASFLLDAAEMRLEYPALKRAVIEQAERWQPHAILIEDRASGQQLLQDFRRETKLPVLAMQPHHDKLSRLAAVSALIEAGRLRVPHHAHWLAAFENQLLQFPAVAHDDFVDALSQYLQWVRGRAFTQPGLRRM